MAIAVCGVPRRLQARNARTRDLSVTSLTILLLSSPTMNPKSGAWLLGGLLYAWQFPHFNALSWNLRPDYSRAGYRMMSVVNPGLTKRVALRYCIATTGLSLAAPLVDLTTWTFAADSLPLNLYLTYLGWQFYRHGDSKTSRKLFHFTLIHLPALLILMWISKKSHSGKASEKETVSLSLSEVNAPVIVKV